MFATMKHPSNSDTLAGALLYYSDPSEINPAKESWPPSALLYEDADAYAKSGGLPRFTFVGAMRDDRPPLVYVGFVRWMCETYSFILPTGETCALHFDKFENANKSLVSHSGRRSSFPVLQHSEPDAMVQYKAVSTFRRSYAGKDLVQSWIGALSLLLAPSTKEMLRILKMTPDDVKSQLSASHSHPQGTGHEKAMYWLWWSCAKPRDLAEWIECHWNLQLTATQLQDIHREYHPTLSGFYRVWVTEEKKEDVSRTVDIMWMTESEWVQYRVDVVLGHKDPSLSFSPDESGRAYLALQNKAVAPYFGKVQGGTFWDVSDSFSRSTAFVVMDLGTIPCAFSRCISSNDDAMTERWIEFRFGPGEAISSDLRLQLDTDAGISYGHMWRNVDDTSTVQK